MPDALPNRIVVVDDNEAKRYTLVRMLQRAGFAVEEATTGADALLLARTMPDLMVLDVKLPDIDGFEVCRQIKAGADTASISVLHVSAHFTTSEYRTQGLEGGADGYLALPIKSEELIATVRALLRLREAEERARRSAGHWQATFDAISDGVCLLDTDGTVVQCNRAMGEICGRAVDAIIGGSFRDLAREVFGLPDRDVSLYGGQVRTRETRELKLEERWFRVTIDPVRTNDVFTGTVCIVTDVTSRKHAEEILRARYHREKRIAETLQDSLLITPPTDEYPGLELEPLYLPALDDAAVGGDFFDIFSPENGKVALVVADVSGKGLAAAARTVEVKYALRAFASEDGDPARILTRLNDFVCAAQRQNHRDHGFIVMTLVLIDTATGEVRATVAGAEPPLIVRADGEQIAFASGGLPLGVYRPFEYTTLHHRLLPGDAIILVTDGITEARRHRDFFGYERMAELAGQALQDTSLAEAGQRILQGAQDFAQSKLHDDVCLLLARRR